MSAIRFSRAIYEEICKCRVTASLTQEPEIPLELHDRAVDICTPLLSIAENLGCAETARAALLSLYADRPDEDPPVSLLGDAVSIVRARGDDFIARDDLLQALHELESGRWQEFCGRDSKALPHRLRSGEMVAILSDLSVRTRNKWPSPRPPGAKSFKVFYRDDLEKAWQALAPDGATSPQPSKVIQLPRP